MRLLFHVLPEAFSTDGVNDEVDGAVQNHHVVAEDVVVPLEIWTRVGLPLAVHKHSA